MTEIKQKQDKVLVFDYMKRVITYGTFDLLHYGHINLLKRAKALGDYLIVVVSTDEFNGMKRKRSAILHMIRERHLLSRSDMLTW